jgi:hypothetical protein
MKLKRKIKGRKQILQIYPYSIYIFLVNLTTDEQANQAIITG